MSRNDRGKNSKAKIIILVVVVAAIIAAVVFAFIKIGSIKDNAEETASVSESVAAKSDSDVGVKLTPAPSSDEKDADTEAKKTTPTPTPTPTKTPEPTKEAKKTTVLKSLKNVDAGTILDEKELDLDNLDKYFVSYEISDEIFDRIYGDDKSYKTYCTVPREDLRYIKLLHRGFDEEIHVGELIVNYLIADDIIDIFEELFENDYQIEKMFLVDDYDADDDLSIDDNNTSAFNYRLTTGGDTISEHGWGVAIDINPINNPYIWNDGSGWVGEDRDYELYLDRDAEDAEERHMINYNDLCYQLFTEHGFEWGGTWGNPIDYQHFEKSIISY